MHQQAWGEQLDITFNRLQDLLAALPTRPNPQVSRKVSLGASLGTTLGTTAAPAQPTVLSNSDPIPRHVGFDGKLDSQADTQCDNASWRSTAEKCEVENEIVNDGSNDSSQSSDLSTDSVYNSLTTPGGNMGRQTTPFSHASMKEYDKKIGSAKNQADRIVAHTASVQDHTMSFKTLRGSLDYFAGALVLLNSFIMLVEFELSGRELGPIFGLEGHAYSSATDSAFLVIDALFVLIFVCEWSLRVWFERWMFVKDIANLFDTVLVFSGAVDLALSLFLADAGGASKSIVVLRLMRAVKSLRAVRMVRSLRFFQGLRVLVKACQCFLPSLCWAMVLLLIFMSMGALMMGNLLQDFVANEDMDFEDRKWVFQRYGTAYRAMYTLFEITFAGNWPTSARPVLEKVSQFYVLFFVPYITLVVFAVIRVISAVFLKDTLDAAQNDAEQLVVDRLRKKAQYVAKLESIFLAIDDTGDGIISEERLNDILQNPKVAAYLETLELDLHEGVALFHLLDNGDGEVTLDEFIDGIMRCKGPARAIDQVAMHADIKALDHKIAKLARKLRDKEAPASAVARDSRATSRDCLGFRGFWGFRGLGFRVWGVWGFGAVCARMFVLAWIQSIVEPSI
ncbi:Scn8a [Symbiodinium natans]|uniref:Scn8a protein n=1 Tax=Symbiodinium natans TaxID=878477 RepID=A0A812N478_9DINO|nr:Scn8a [Symbiodinium natans]